MSIKYLGPTVIGAFCVVAILMPNAVFAQLDTGWKAHDGQRPSPKIVVPADEVALGKPPADAVVLFDGTDLRHWTGGADKWKIVDGVMVTVPKAGYAITKEKFGDCQLHLEWAAPQVVKGKGQQRGNSGVFLMGQFEIQILDSWENETYADGAVAAVYGQYPPLVNASRKPGQWQSYDIIFRAPKFDEAGNLLKRARITVLHNGVLVQDAQEILGPTSWIKHGQYAKGMTTGPISLQDHGKPVRYRNIWVRHLKPERVLPEKPYPKAGVQLDPAQIVRLTGVYKAGQQTFNVRRVGDELFCEFYQVEMRMIPMTERKFLFAQCAGEIVFEFDSEGNTTQATLKLDAAGKRVGQKKSNE